MQLGEEAAVPDASGQPDPDAASPHVEPLELVLAGAADLDQLSRLALGHLAALPGVARAGLAVTEGAGRRLRFAASDQVSGADLAEPLAWCHIDAYDDVPLTTVARTGGKILGGFDDLAGTYVDYVAHQRALGNHALAALPLTDPGGTVLGGMVLFFDRPQSFSPEETRAYEHAAGAIAGAMARVRSAAEARGHDADAFHADDVHRATMALEADPRAAGAARRFLRERLAAWQVDDDVVETAQLCVSELVNNVIMHAGTSSRLTASLEERQLTVLLRDLGGAADGEAQQHRPVDDTDEFRVFGRGLTLVDALADDWGSHRDDLGTTAWFVCRLPEAARAG